jgi:hypothetical protein
VRFVGKSRLGFHPLPSSAAQRKGSAASGILIQKITASKRKHSKRTVMAV